MEGDVTQDSRSNVEETETSDIDESTLPKIIITDTDQIQTHGGENVPTADSSSDSQVVSMQTKEDSGTDLSTIADIRDEEEIPGTPDSLNQDPDLHKQPEELILESVNADELQNAPTDSLADSVTSDQTEDLISRHGLLDSLEEGIAVSPEADDEVFTDLKADFVMATIEEKSEPNSREMSGAEDGAEEEDVKNDKNNTEEVEKGKDPSSADKKDDKVDNSNNRDTANASNYSERPIISSHSAHSSKSTSRSSTNDLSALKMSFAKLPKCVVSSDYDLLAVGDRVITQSNRLGTLKYLGRTRFAIGMWGGIELDESSGKNDGSVGATRYFTCPSTKGIFVKRDNLQKITLEHKLANTKAAFDLHIGDEVYYVTPDKTIRIGFVRFIGLTEFASGTWVGIELHEEKGLNDGQVDEKRYFTCANGYGIFIRVSKVKKYIENNSINQNDYRYAPKRLKRHRSQPATPPSTTPRHRTNSCPVSSRGKNYAAPQDRTARSRVKKKIPTSTSTDDDDTFLDSLDDEEEEEEEKGDENESDSNESPSATTSSGGNTQDDSSSNTKRKVQKKKKKKKKKKYPMSFEQIRKTFAAFDHRMGITEKLIMKGYAKLRDEVAECRTQLDEKDEEIRTLRERHDIEDVKSTARQISTAPITNLEAISWCALSDPGETLATGKTGEENMDLHHQEVIDMHDGEIEALKTVRRTLKSEQNSEIGEIKTLKTDCETIQSEQFVVIGEIETFKTDCETIQSEQVVVIGEIKALKTDWEKIKSEQVVVIGEIKALKTDWETIKSKQVVVIEEIKALKTDWATIQSEQVVAIGDIKALKTDSETIKSEQVVVIGDIKALKTDSETIQSEQVVVVEEIKALKTDWEAIQSEQVVVIGDIKALKTDSETIKSIQSEIMERKQIDERKNIEDKSKEEISHEIKILQQFIDKNAEEIDTVKGEQKNIISLTCDISTAEGLLSDNFDEIQRIVTKVGEEFQVVKELQEQNADKYDLVLFAEDVTKNAIDALKIEFDEFKNDVTMKMNERPKKKDDYDEIKEKMLKFEEDISELTHAQQLCPKSSPNDEKSRAVSKPTVITTSGSKAGKTKIAKPFSLTKGTGGSRIRNLDVTSKKTKTTTTAKSETKQKEEETKHKVEDGEKNNKELEKLRAEIDTIAKTLKTQEESRVISIKFLTDEISSLKDAQELFNTLSSLKDAQESFNTLSSLKDAQESFNTQNEQIENVLTATVRNDEKQTTTVMDEIERLKVDLDSLNNTQKLNGDMNTLKEDTQESRYKNYEEDFVETQIEPTDVSELHGESIEPSELNTDPGSTALEMLLDEINSIKEQASISKEELKTVIKSLASLDEQTQNNLKTLKDESTTRSDYKDDPMSLHDEITAAGSLSCAFSDAHSGKQNVEYKSRSSSKHTGSIKALQINVEQLNAELDLIKSAFHTEPSIQMMDELEKIKIDLSSLKDTQLSRETFKSGSTTDSVFEFSPYTDNIMTSAAIKTSQDEIKEFISDSVTQQLQQEIMFLKEVLQEDISKVNVEVNVLKELHTQASKQPAPRERCNESGDADVETVVELTADIEQIKDDLAHLVQKSDKEREKTKESVQMLQHDVAELKDAQSQFTSDAYSCHTKTKKSKQISSTIADDAKRHLKIPKGSELKRRRTFSAPAASPAPTKSTAKQSVEPVADTEPLKYEVIPQLKAQCSFVTNEKIEEIIDQLKVEEQQKLNDLSNQIIAFKGSRASELGKVREELKALRGIQETNLVVSQIEVKDATVFSTANIKDYESFVEEINEMKEKASASDKQVRQIIQSITTLDEKTTFNFNAFADDIKNIQIAMISDEDVKMLDNEASSLMIEQEVTALQDELVKFGNAEKPERSLDEDSGLPESGLPDSGLPQSGLPASRLPDSGLPQTGLPDAGLPLNNASSKDRVKFVSQANEYRNKKYEEDISFLKESHQIVMVQTAKTFNKFMQQDESTKTEINKLKHEINSSKYELNQYNAYAENTLESVANLGSRISEIKNEFTQYIEEVSSKKEKAEEMIVKMKEKLAKLTENTDKLSSKDESIGESMKKLEHELNELKKSSSQPATAPSESKERSGSVSKTRAKQPPKPKSPAPRSTTSKSTVPKSLTDSRRHLNLPKGGGTKVSSEHEQTEPEIDAQKLKDDINSLQDAQKRFVSRDEINKVVDTKSDRYLEKINLLEDKLTQLQTEISSKENNVKLSATQDGSMQPSHENVSSQDDIRKISDELSSIKSVQKANVSQDEFKKVVNSITAQEEQRAMSFRMFSEEIRFLKEAQKLNASKDSIEEIHEEIYFLKNFERSDTRPKDRLESIPEELVSSQTLETVTNLEDKIKMIYHEVEMLKESKNKFDDINENISSLKSVQKLNVSQDEFKKVMNFITAQEEQRAMSSRMFSEEIKALKESQKGLTSQGDFDDIKKEVSSIKSSQNSNVIQDELEKAVTLIAKSQLDSHLKTIEKEFKESEEKINVKDDVKRILIKLTSEEERRINSNKMMIEQINSLRKSQETMVLRDEVSSLVESIMADKATNKNMDVVEEEMIVQDSILDVESSSYGEALWDIENKQQKTLDVNEILDEIKFIKEDITKLSHSITQDTRDIRTLKENNTMMQMQQSSPNRNEMNTEIKYVADDLNILKDILDTNSKDMKMMKNNIELMALSSDVTELIELFHAEFEDSKREVALLHELQEKMATKEEVLKLNETFVNEKEMRGEHIEKMKEDIKNDKRLFASKIENEEHLANALTAVTTELKFLSEDMEQLKESSVNDKNELLALISQLNTEREFLSGNYGKIMEDNLKIKRDVDILRGSQTQVFGQENERNHDNSLMSEIEKINGNFRILKSDMIIDKSEMMDLIYQLSAGSEDLDENVVTLQKHIIEGKKDIERVKSNLTNLVKDTYMKTFVDSLQDKYDFEIEKLKELNGKLKYDKDGINKQLETTREEIGYFRVQEDENNRALSQSILEEVGSLRSHDDEITKALTKDVEELKENMKVMLQLDLDKQTIYTNIDNLEEKTDSIRNEVDVLKENVVFERKNLLKNFDQFETEQEGMNNSIDRLDQKTEKVEKEVEILITNQAKYSKQFTALRETVTFDKNTILTSFDQFDVEKNCLNENIEQLEEKTRHVEKELKYIKIKQDNVISTFSMFKETFTRDKNNLLNTIEQLDTERSCLHGNIQMLEMDVEENKSKIKDIEENVCSKSEITSELRNMEKNLDQVRESIVVNRKEIMQLVGKLNKEVECLLHEDISALREDHEQTVKHLKMFEHRVLKLREMILRKTNDIWESLAEWDAERTDFNKSLEELKCNTRTNKEELERLKSQRNNEEIGKLKSRVKCIEQNIENDEEIITRISKQQDYLSGFIHQFSLAFFTDEDYVSIQEALVTLTQNVKTLDKRSVEIHDYDWFVDKVHTLLSILNELKVDLQDVKKMETTGKTGELLSLLELNRVQEIVNDVKRRAGSDEVISDVHTMIKQNWPLEIQPRLNAGSGREKSVSLVSQSDDDVFYKEKTSVSQGGARSYHKPLSLNLENDLVVKLAIDQVSKEVLEEKIQDINQELEVVRRIQKGTSSLGDVTTVRRGTALSMSLQDHLRESQRKYLPEANEEIKNEAEGERQKGAATENDDVDYLDLIRSLQSVGDVDAIEEQKRASESSNQTKHDKPSIKEKTSELLLSHFIKNLVKRLSQSKDITQVNIERLADVIIQQNKALHLLNDKQESVCKRDAAVQLVNQLIFDGTRIKEGFFQIKYQIERENKEMKMVRCGESKLVVLETKFETANQNLSDHFHSLQDIVKKLSKQLIEEKIDIDSMEMKQENITSLTSRFIEAEVNLKENYQRMNDVIVHAYEEVQSTRDTHTVSDTKTGPEMNTLLETYFTTAGEFNYVEHMEKLNAAKEDARLKEIEEKNKKDIYKTLVELRIDIDRDNAEIEEMKEKQANLYKLKQQFIDIKNLLEDDFIKIQKIVKSVDEEIQAMRELKMYSEEIGSEFKQLNESFEEIKKTVEADSKEIKHLKDKQDKLMILKDQFRQTEILIKKDFDTIQELIMNVDEELEVVKEKSKKKANIETVLLLIDRVSLNERNANKELDWLKNTLKQVNTKTESIKKAQAEINDKDQLGKLYSKVNDITEVLKKNNDKLKKDVDKCNKTIKRLIVQQNGISAVEAKLQAELKELSEKLEAKIEDGASNIKIQTLLKQQDQKLYDSITETYVRLNNQDVELKNSIKSLMEKQSEVETRSTKIEELINKNNGRIHEELGTNTKSVEEKLRKDFEKRIKEMTKKLRFEMIDANEITKVTFEKQLEEVVLRETRIIGLMQDNYRKFTDEVNNTNTTIKAVAEKQKTVEVRQTKIEECIKNNNTKVSDGIDKNNKTINSFIKKQKDLEGAIMESSLKTTREIEDCQQRIELLVNKQTDFNLTMNSCETTLTGRVSESNEKFLREVQKNNVHIKFLMQKQKEMDSCDMKISEKLKEIEKSNEDIKVLSEKQREVEERGYELESLVTENNEKIIFEFEQTHKHLNNLQELASVAENAVKDNFNQMNIAIDKNRLEIDKHHDEIAELKVVNTDHEKKSAEISERIQKINSDVLLDNKIVEEIQTKQEEFVKEKTEVNEALKDMNENIRKSFQEIEIARQITIEEVGANIHNFSKRLQNTEQFLLDNFNPIRDEINKNIEAIEILNETEEQLSEQITINQSEMEKIQMELQTDTRDIQEIKDWQKDFNKGRLDIKQLEGHIENIENLLFLDDNMENTKLKWVLSHYQYHFDKGKAVYSPLFYTELNGYRFQLGINWLGETKRSLGVYLYLWKGPYCQNQDLPTFNVPYTLGILNKKREDTSTKVSFFGEPRPEKVEEKEGTQLPLPKNKMRSHYKPYLLPMPSLDDYLVNDTLTIFCTFKTAVEYSKSGGGEMKRLMSI